MIAQAEELKPVCCTFAIKTYIKYTRSRERMDWVVSKILPIGTLA